MGDPEPGPDPVTGVAIEGYGGLEAQAAVKYKIQGPNFALESTLNAYVQLDVISNSGALTLFKRSWELTKCEGGKCVANVSSLLP